MALVVSIVRLKYISDTAKETVKGIKGKPAQNTFSEDSIRKLIREELIKLMK